MCVIVAKYFKEHGWCAAKNRDQDYIPDVKFADKNVKGVGEILVMYDENTGYKEGMNYSGLCIITTSLTPILTLETNKRDGDLIYKALHMKDPKEAAHFLVKNQLCGFVFIFNSEHMYLLEGGKDNLGKGQYKHSLREVPHTETIARTNHGVDLEWSGFQKGVSDTLDFWRKSSENRMKIAQKVAEKAKTPIDLLKGLGAKVSTDLQMNSFRCAYKPRQMRTIFQNLIIPKEKTMRVIPIQCKMEIDTDREFVKCVVLPNDHINKTYKGHIKHFAHIERDGSNVKCVEESVVNHFKHFLKGQ
jgi:hypothetical protein